MSETTSVTKTRKTNRHTNK